MICSDEDVFLFLAQPVQRFLFSRQFHKFLISVSKLSSLGLKTAKRGCHSKCTPFGRHYLPEGMTRDVFQSAWYSGTRRSVASCHTYVYAIAGCFCLVRSYALLEIKIFGLCHWVLAENLSVLRSCHTIFGWYLLLPPISDTSCQTPKTR